MIDTHYEPVLDKKVARDMITERGWDAGYSISEAPTFKTRQDCTEGKNPQGTHIYFQPHSSTQEFIEYHNVDGLIPGLFCPNCHSQGYKTDQPGVAVCGACTGWYFFYQEKKDLHEKKMKVIIKNGDYVEVPVEDEEEKLT